MNRIITLFLALSCIWSTQAYADAGNPATLLFDLNACTSFTTDGTNSDYSEFTGVAVNTSEIELSVVNNNLYRLDPIINRHSCTPGINNTEAMCISYDTNCQYMPGSSRAARIDISLSPTGSGPVRLSNLSFYEMAPVMFDWIDGPSGANNYPTLYGVRILRDGQVIFDESAQAATTDWTLESFDFSGPDFEVSEQTTFSVEFLAYCPIGVFATQTVWDLDEIQFTAECVAPVGCQANGGELVGGPFTFDSVGDGVADMIPAGSIISTNTSGQTLGWLVTDDQGYILGMPPMPGVVNFDNPGAGTCLIWRIAYDGAITGLSLIHI